MSKLALINGDIWIMDDPGKTCESVLIEDGLIAQTGTTAEVLASVERGNPPYYKYMTFDSQLLDNLIQGNYPKHNTVRVIDLCGKTVLPGFIDTHMHLESFALAMLQVDLKYPLIKDIEDIKDALRREKNADGRWIVGNLYDHNKLTEKSHPTKWDLDQVSLDQPILIFHISGHMVSVNSKALEIAGIDCETPDPAGGRIERTPEGEPTGVLFETAFNLVIGYIPPYTREEKASALDKAMALLLEKGITGVHDMGVEDYTIDLELYQDIYKQKRLKTRISMLYPYASAEKAAFDLEDCTSGFNGQLALNNDFIKLLGLKCFSDGSMVGRTAAVKKPYRDGSGNGMMLLNEDQLKKMAGLAKDKNLQIGIHAIGDRALEKCLNAYEAVLKNDAHNNRFRIEHCGIGSTEAFERMQNMNILVASQPQFVRDFGDGILLNYHGEVIPWIYAYRSMLDKGLHLSFSSDAPVTDPDPLLTIRCSVNRNTETERPFCPEENISLYEAVKCYSYEGAYASFEEDKKGMIKPGYFADMVILTDRLTLDSLSSISVEKTLLAGEIEFSKEEGL